MSRQGSKKSLKHARSFRESLRQSPRHSKLSPGQTLSIDYVEEKNS